MYNKSKFSLDEWKNIYNMINSDDADNQDLVEEIMKENLDFIDSQIYVFMKNIKNNHSKFATLSAVHFNGIEDSELLEYLINIYLLKVTDNIFPKIKISGINVKVNL